jgi:hypothetical protein
LEIEVRKGTGKLKTLASGKSTQTVLHESMCKAREYKRKVGEKRGLMMFTIWRLEGLEGGPDFEGHSIS